MTSRNAAGSFQLVIAYLPGGRRPRRPAGASTKSGRMIHHAVLTTVAVAVLSLAVLGPPVQAQDKPSAQELAAWFRRAAEQSHAGAQHNLWMMYANGRGVPQNDAEVVTWYGCVATFKKRHARDWSSRTGFVSCRHVEQRLDALNLLPNLRTAPPPRLPLPDHVQGFVALDRPPRRVECTKALLDCHASFDRSMIRLHDVGHVGDRPMLAAGAQGAFLFHCWNRRAVETGLIGVDDTGLRMRGIVTPASHQLDSAVTRSHPL